MRFLLSVLAVAAIVSALIYSTAPRPGALEEAERGARVAAKYRAAVASDPEEWAVMRTPPKSTVPALDQFVIESE